MNDYDKEDLQGNLIKKDRNQEHLVDCLGNCRKKTIEMSMSPKCYIGKKNNNKHHINNITLQKSWKQN